jgi:hypothetical protein
MRDLMNRIETLWCEHMHSAVMWPIHGKYRCGECLREYAVGFEGIERRNVEPRRAAPIVASV